MVLLQHGGGVVEGGQHGRVVVADPVSVRASCSIGRGLRMRGVTVASTGPVGGGGGGHVKCGAGRGRGGRGGGRQHAPQQPGALEAAARRARVEAVAGGGAGHGAGGGARPAQQRQWLEVRYLLHEYSEHGLKLDWVKLTFQFEWCMVSKSKHLESLKPGHK